MTIFEGTLTIIGTFLSGGMAIKVLDRFSLGKKDQYDTLVMLVEQLQKNVNSNNEKVDRLEKEVEHWKERFYAELEQKNTLKQQVTNLTHELKKFNAKDS